MNPPPNRFLSIDLFKTLGIVYLIILHEVVWFFTYGDGAGVRYDEFVGPGTVFGYKLGLHVFGFSIPLLAGITYYLSVQKKRLSFTQVAKRSIVLILLGYGMNVLAWGWGNFFDWDALQFLGLSFMICYPMVKNPSKIKMGILYMAGIMALVMSRQFPSENMQDNYFWIIVLGDRLGESYWALCPWFFIFVTGIFIAKHYFEEKSHWLIFLLLGGLMVSCSIFTQHFLPVLNQENVWGVEVFKPSAFFVVGIAGFCIAAIPLVEHLLKIRHWEQSLTKFPGLIMGRQTLAVYLFSTIFGFKITEFAAMSFDLTYRQAVVAFFIILIINITCSYLVAHMITNIQKQKVAQ
jgi:hypothetical protein